MGTSTFFYLFPTPPRIYQPYSSASLELNFDLLIPCLVDVVNIGYLTAYKIIEVSLNQSMLTLGGIHLWDCLIHAIYDLTLDLD